jgi:hypothetical protein
MRNSAFPGRAAGGQFAMRLLWGRSRERLENFRDRAGLTRTNALLDLRQVVGSARNSDSRAGHPRRVGVKLKITIDNAV